MKLETRGSIRVAACIGLALLILAGAAAQTPIEETKPGDAKPAEAYRTFYLKYLAQQPEAADVLQAVRNTLSHTRSYLVPFENALVVRGSAEDLAVAQRVIEDLDRPQKVYRLTYTITEMDGGKRMGAQHLSLVVASGSRAVLKQGNRVPLVTGNPAAGNTEATAPAPSTLVQYIDVGQSIEANLDGASEGLRLHTKVEQSSVAEEKSGLGAQDPVIRQTALDVYTGVTPDKPLILGSFDVPGGTLRREVEVVAEVLK